MYDEIKQYIWKSSGLGAIDVLKGLLDLFEEGAANGKHEEKGPDEFSEVFIHRMPALSKESGRCQAWQKGWRHPCLKYVHVLNSQTRCPLLPQRFCRRNASYVFLISASRIKMVGTIAWSLCAT